MPPDWITFCESLAATLREVFGCHHPNVRLCEGKCYCPDCGQGLIFDWVVWRCDGCQCRREMFRCSWQIRVLQRFCPSCGSSQLTRRVIESPAFYQLHYAYLQRRQNNPTYFWKHWRTPEWMDWVESEVLNRTVHQFRLKLQEKASGFQPGVQSIRLLGTSLQQPIT